MKLIRIDKTRQQKNKQCICRAYGKTLQQGEVVEVFQRSNKCGYQGVSYQCLQCSNKNVLVYQMKRRPTRHFMPHVFLFNSEKTKAEVKTQNVF
jgi:hypothetical protein